MNSARFNMFRPRRLSAFLRGCVPAVALLGIASASLCAENAYWDEFGAKSVYVEQNNNGRKQEMKFLGFKDGMLVAEIEMKNPDGSTAVAEVSQPVSESMVRTLNLKLQLANADRQVEAKNFDGALNVMRPDVYPLIKFAEVPSTFRQLHVAVLKLLNLLIQTENYDEALDLLGRIPLDKVSIEYSEVTLRLLNAYLANGDYETAASLAATLPIEGDYAKNISPIMTAADKLRVAGNYEAVIPLYQSIRDVVPASAQANIDMWLAYSLVLADRLDEAVPLIDSLTEPAPKERLFSLYKMLQGSLEYRKENYSVALDTLTRGFVRAQTSYSWVPEMLYLVGDCYARSEEPEAARNVWTEISILYPDTVWAPRANEALAKLPPKEETTEEE